MAAERARRIQEAKQPIARRLGEGRMLPLQDGIRRPATKGLGFALMLAQKLCEVELAIICRVDSLGGQRVRCQFVYNCRTDGGHRKEHLKRTFSRLCERECQGRSADLFRQVTSEKTLELWDISHF
jgi:hypothetical protein